MSIIMTYKIHLFPLCILFLQKKGGFTTHIETKHVNQHEVQNYRINIQFCQTSISEKKA